MGKSRLPFLSIAAKVLTAFLLIVPIAASVKLPELMQRSDYLTAFYVAGKMVLEGHTAQLYPGAAAETLLNTPFNTFAHQFLNHLPECNTAIYMYSPLIAGLFVPFALLPPQASLIAWQLTSITALVLCAVMLASITKGKPLDLFLICSLCFAVFQTLLLGAIGISTGLLPLCGGYLLLMRKKYFLAGIVLALLLLKPQFLPTALLVAGALAFSGRPACAFGLASGLAGLSLFTVFCLSPPVFYHWILSLKLSDSIFTSPQYGYPVYLVTSLPAMILHLFPMGMRNAVKLPCYLMSAAIGLHALWLATKMIRSNSNEPQRILPFIMLVGVLVLPLVLPHFLFYDLCVLTLAAMIIFGHKWQDAAVEKEFKRLLVLAYVLVDTYMILYISPAHDWALPVVLVAGLLVVYARVVSLASRDPKIENLP